MKTEDERLDNAIVAVICIVIAILIAGGAAIYTWLA